MLILTGNSFSRIQAPFSLSYVKGILWKDEITNIIAVKKIVIRYIYAQATKQGETSKF
jgi:hypothetical protein